MRLLKFVVFLAIAAGMFSLWQQRESVVSAYRDDPTATELRLDGLDVAFDATPIAESPHALSVAPDARRIRLSTVETVPPPLEDEPDLPSMGGGRARVDGVVTGPEGPVAGAVVRIQRHTFEGVVEEEVVTDAAGAWSVRGLRGGRYSVRAFVPNSLTSGTPSLFFLEDADKGALNLELVAAPTGRDAEVVGPTHIVPAEPAVVSITLGRWIVDAEGRLVRLPASAVELNATGFAPVTVLSERRVTTDSGGAVSFVVECAEEGPAAINLSGTAEGVLFAAYAELPPCSFTPPPPPPDEEDEDGASDGTEGADG